MKSLVPLIFCIMVVTNYHECNHRNFRSDTFKWPTIAISVLVRNKEHTLPYFLSSLYQLDYPKRRLYIWMYSDYNEDNSINVLEKWVARYSSEYNGVYLTTNTSTGSIDFDEMRSTPWTQLHFEHVIQLREVALDFARDMWADYIFMVDADVYFTEPLVLKDLVSKGHTVVAPMLDSDGLYSNFWCGMSSNFYYKRTDDYKLIQSREKIGCFEVVLVHTALLISLRVRESDVLTYDPMKAFKYDGPVDDIIVFAVNANKYGIKLNICNDKFYGFMQVPLEEHGHYSDDHEQLLNIKLKAIARGKPLVLDGYMKNFVRYPPPWKMGCDEIYMINLERRPKRRMMMEMNFMELGMSVKHFNAIDGSNLDSYDLSQYGISYLKGYEDPYQKRPMKAGEVGCFLSHYKIWEEVVKNNLGITMVLEDDINFVPYFLRQFLVILDEVAHQDWDFVYIGRKILHEHDEVYVAHHLTKPHYSYWTLGYLISQRGAAKLLDAKPLTKLLPVDEFLPIMFDEHPNDTWKSYFPNRNLNAFSAEPLLVHPTHYTGQKGYISDTEDSPLVPTPTNQSTPLQRIRTEL